MWRCRSLAQLLVVLDDGDLHQRQTPFSLGASRAIASTLNSLVFHTAFPETAGQQQQQPGQHLKQQPAAELSAQVAPATLAHGMVSTGSTATVLSAGLSQTQRKALLGTCSSKHAWGGGYCAELVCAVEQGGSQHTQQIPWPVVAHQPYARASAACLSLHASRRDC